MSSSRFVAIFTALFLNTQLSDAKVPMLALNDGNKMPGFALGTGRGTIKEGEKVDLVKDAVLWSLVAGYRHIDTASAYKDEEQVGEGIAAAIEKGIVKREDVYVTTKLWNTDHPKDKVLPALRQSLHNLKLDYVDLYLIHFPIPMKEDGSPGTTDYLETWKAMEEVKRLGLARSIGVSNFNKEQIDRLIQNSEIKPAVNQIEVNPTFTNEELVQHCQNLGIAVMAYSPMGFVVTRKNDKQIPPGLNDPELTKLAEKYKKTVPQILLRYLIDRGTIPVSKSTNEKRIKENLDIFDFKLTKVEIETINKFNKNMRVIEPKGWKDYPYYPFEKN